MLQLKSYVQPDIACIGALLAVQGPLSVRDSNSLLDSMERVLRAAGYVLQLQDNEGWTFSRPGEKPSLPGFGSEAQVLYHAYSDFLGRANSTSFEFVKACKTCQASVPAMLN